MGINITGLGAANGIGFKSKVSGGRYLPPDLKARLVSVTSCYGKKNTDSDKDILKDKTGQGNDLIVYNGTFDNIKDGYDAPFFSFMNPALTVDTKFVTYIDEVTLKSIGPDINCVVLYTNPAKYKKRIPSFIINVNCSKSCRYYYIDKNKPNVRTVFNLQQGVNAVPESYADLYSGTEDEGAVNAIGFALDEGATLEVKQLSRYTGGLLTSGINGVGTFVESVKPFKEMVGDSQSVSIVSMISILEPISINYEITINNVRAITNELYGRNVFKGTEIDKTYIIGYYANLPSSTNNIGIINNILGDDKDWTYQSGGNIVDTAKLSIQGFRGTSSMPYAMVRSVIYWNIVLKGKATIDEINQVIEYFNLDRPGVVVKPDILYDIKRQGITNDNHAEFEDKLKDFIYGFDMQMYNMNWEGTSGINTYPVVFGSNKTWYSLTIKNYEYTLNPNIIHLTHIDTAVALQYTYLKNNGVISNINREAPAFKLKVTGLNNNIYIYYRYLATSDATTISMYDIREDGIYDIPKSYKVTNAMTLPTVFTSLGIGNTDGVFEHDCNLTLEILPDNEGALNLNGINNFGKVTNVPVWKDYTIASLRKWLYTESVDNGIGVGGLISKSKVGQDGAFIAEQSFLLNPNKTAGYNFGAGNSSLLNDKINEKSFAIQTKYTYGINRQTLSVGNGLDTNTLWFGTVRDNDTRFSYLALWNLMLFHYTMSNFILERQLKKYKLGSLYPDNSFPFRPVVTANSSTKSIQYFDVVTGKSLAVGDYVAKEQQIQLNIMLNDIDEVIKVTIDGKEVPLYSYNDGYYRYRFNIHNSYPKIDITIQEYVKYDDIVQPYPVIFVLQDKESGKELTYGNYVKVGDIIKVKSVIYYNQDLWSIQGYQIGDDSKIYSYNQLINKDIVVTKPLSFGCIKKWLLSTAEPLFVYDPAIFTNNAIKTLGYLPDISGQNRHLKLYNFSYEGMSGKDGYPVVFGKNKTWENIRPENDNWKYGLSSTGITIYKALDTTPLLYTIIRESGGTIKPISIPSFKINVKGLQDGESIRYRYFSIDNPSTYSNIIITKNGKHELPASVPLQSDSTILDVYIGFQVKLNNNESVKGLIIEILPNYEGSLYFDGVNNYGTVQNLDHGGKCLVSKLNYNLKSSIIYDQRSTLDNTPDTNTFALYIGNNNNNVYSERLTGDVYINNVLNNYIGNTDLNNNTHVVTATCSIVDSSNSIGSIFGRSKTGSTYAQFAMYRTILLPEVPNAADRAILNKWCGLPTGYLPKPEYYWDVTGKSNSDTATRNTIKNLGTAKPVASTSDEDAYSLENKNVAYEGMSGYNGYPVVFGANKTWETYATYNFTSTINDNKLHITKVLNSNGLIFSYVKRNDELLNIKEIPSFKIKVTGLEGESKLLYFYLSEENAANITILTLENGVHKIPKSLIPTNALPNSTWIGFKITSIQEGVSSFDCDITLEILPDYYGLCLDGITNYIECANIPAFTDYTYILMRQILSNNIPNSVTMHKGIVKAYAGAFTADYVINNEEAYINKFAFHSFGATNIIYRNKVANKIILANTTSVNGIAVSRGSNTDDESITIAKFENNYRRMVFYKLMLWSKSITNTYHINMLRNLINNGGIIDLNDSIFDQTSNE
jgi:hypothetical protein